MSKITDRVFQIAEPIVKNSGCELWDVEYVKEAGIWYLRIYIDKENGVGISDCENISRALDPILDELDPIPTSYTFEVGSAGAERALKRPSDFEKFIGSLISVKLYSPMAGKKEYIGYLISYDDGAVTIKADNEEKKFEKNEVAGVHLRME